MKKRYRALVYIDGEQRWFAIYAINQEDAEGQVSRMFVTEDDYVAICTEL